jgi:hypothetical protein
LCGSSERRLGKGGTCRGCCGGGRTDEEPHPEGLVNEKGQAREEGGATPERETGQPMDKAKENACGKNKD